MRDPRSAREALWCRSTTPAARPESMLAQNDRAGFMLTDTSHFRSVDWYSKCTDCNQGAIGTFSRAAWLPAHPSFRKRKPSDTSCVLRDGRPQRQRSYAQ